MHWIINHCMCYTFDFEMMECVHLSFPFVCTISPIVCIALYQHIANFKLQIKCLKCFNSGRNSPSFHEPLVACTFQIPPKNISVRENPDKFSTSIYVHLNFSNISYFILKLTFFSSRWRWNQAQATGTLYLISEKYMWYDFNAEKKTKKKLNWK